MLLDGLLVWVSVLLIGSVVVIVLYEGVVVELFVCEG